MRIFPLSENAVTVEFGSVISLQLNKKALALADHLNAEPFPGYVESVPAYTSTTVFFDLKSVQNSYPNFATASDAVADIIATIVSNADLNIAEKNRTIEIPVKFNDANGPDLCYAAEASGLTVDEFLNIFTSSSYRVYMHGFLPGFAYMGEVDERIALPRLSSPRTNVPARSVGIAGRQTGIYPFNSPGGWQLIGRTDVRVFDPNADSPCLFEPGDQVILLRV